MAYAVIFAYRHQERLLHNTHALVKLISLITTCFLLLTGSPLLVGIISLTLLGLLIIQRLPIRSYFRQGRFFFVLFILIGGSEYLASGQWQSALMKIARYALMILYAMLITDSTSPDELAGAIPLLNRTIIATGIELTLAMVPMIFRVSEEVSAAHRARAMKWSIRTLFTYLASLFEVLFLRLEEEALALQGRLFQAHRRRAYQSFTLIDLPLFFLTLLFITVEVIR
ncbi:MAG: energy-coupling factor transporter transmembrane protein EcfT [Sphaerochaeta sp.]